MPLPQDDPLRRKPDIAAASSLLGWQPSTPLKAGLLQTIDDFRDRLSSNADRSIARQARTVYVPMGAY
jgi:UDP-glucuronate decarboxylase